MGISKSDKTETYNVWILPLQSSSMENHQCKECICDTFIKQSIFLSQNSVYIKLFMESKNMLKK